MSNLYISNVAFGNANDERAHFAEMNGRLRSLNNIYTHLDVALDSLRTMHASLAVQIEELKAYVSNLSPDTDAVALPVQPRRIDAVGKRSVIKAWVSKLAPVRTRA